MKDDEITFLRVEKVSANDHWTKYSEKPRRIRVRILKIKRKQLRRVTILIKNKYVVSKLHQRRRNNISSSRKSICQRQLDEIQRETTTNSSQKPQNKRKQLPSCMENLCVEVLSWGHVKGHGEND